MIPPLRHVKNRGGVQALAEFSKLSILLPICKSKSMLLN